MTRDGARRREPYRVAVPGDMAKCTPEMPEPMRLADDIGVQRDAHHQWPLLRQLQHLVELVDQNAGELRGTVLAPDERNQTGWSSMHQSSI